MDFNCCSLKPVTKETFIQMSEWEYEGPYSVYSFKGKPNTYLSDESKWGDEQFCLMCGDKLYGYVTCELEMGVIWVGWAFSPEYCGMGEGHVFVKKCVEEIRRMKNYSGDVYLRVAAWNMRAIKAYEKAGFMHIMTIQDEIAHTGKREDFWVMAVQS